MGKFKAYSKDIEDKLHLFDNIKKEQEMYWVEHLTKPSNCKWGCGMIVKDEDGKFLLGKRSEYCNEAGSWGFLGGSVEDGQCADDAILRECIEESNLYISDMNLIQIEGTDISKLNFVYETTLSKCLGRMRRQSSEVSELKWFTAEEIFELNLFHASEETWRIYIGDVKEVKETLAYFCSGHRDITEKEFEEHYIPQFEDILQAEELKRFNLVFYVGNWQGADKYIQMYIEDYLDDYELEKDRIFVKVCAVAGSEIENIWPRYETLKWFVDWADADHYMTRNTMIDITWVRKGKEDSGSAQNIQRRIDYQIAERERPNFIR